MYNIDHHIVLMIWLHSYATKFNDQTIILLCLPCVRALSRYLGTNDKVQIVVPSTIYTLSFSDRQMPTIILLQVEPSSFGRPCSLRIDVSSDW